MDQATQAATAEAVNMDQSTQAATAEAVNMDHTTQAATAEAAAAEASKLDKEAAKLERQRLHAVKQEEARTIRELKKEQKRAAHEARMLMVQQRKAERVAEAKIRHEKAQLAALERQAIKAEKKAIHEEKAAEAMILRRSKLQRTVTAHIDWDTITALVHTAMSTHGTVESMRLVPSAKPYFTAVFENAAAVPKPGKQMQAAGLDLTVMPAVITENCVHFCAAAMLEAGADKRTIAEEANQLFGKVAEVRSAVARGTFFVVEYATLAGAQAALATDDPGFWTLLGSPLQLCRGTPSKRAGKRKGKSGGNGDAKKLKE